MIFIPSKFGKHVKVAENGFLYQFQRDNVTGYATYHCASRRGGCKGKAFLWPGQDKLFISEPHNHNGSEVTVQAEITKVIFIVDFQTVGFQT